MLDIFSRKAQDNKIYSIPSSLDSLSTLLNFENLRSEDEVHYSITREKIFDRKGLKLLRKDSSDIKEFNFISEDFNTALLINSEGKELAYLKGQNSGKESSQKWDINFTPFGAWNRAYSSITLNTENKTKFILDITVDSTIRSYTWKYESLFSSNWKLCTKESKTTIAKLKMANFSSKSFGELTFLDSSPLADELIILLSITFILYNLEGLSKVEKSYLQLTL